MRHHSQPIAWLGVFTLAVLGTGCEKQAPPAAAPAKPKENAPAAPAAKPAPAHPEPAAPKPPPASPHGATAPTAAPGESKPAAALSGSTLQLQGVSMTVPAGWVQEQVTPGPMSAVAVFRVPKVEGEAEDATVRVTYFPNMKGQDDANVDRWISQIGKPDGTPSTRADVKVSSEELTNVRLTIVDGSGTVKATMRAQPQPDSRMIAAIVDHPQGPHFVVVAGGVKTIDKAQADVLAFLRSAKMTP